VLASPLRPANRAAIKREEAHEAKHARLLGDDRVFRGPVDRGNRIWPKTRRHSEAVRPRHSRKLSLLEEPTIGAEMPMMGVFNSLILFDQHKKQVSLETIVPDLATGWSWNEDGTELTFKLRHGVKWHDGKPFTAEDVKCSIELRLGTAAEKLRLNFQKSAFYNLAAVTTNGDFAVTFHLKRPQPAFPMLLAGGFSAVTPCHLSPAELRQHPVGTGPFKFVEFKPDEYIKVTRNPDYWKPDQPYLDGVEYTIIRDPSTAVLAFVAGKFDMTFPYDLTIPLMQDVQRQVPQAICELATTGVNRHLLVNYHSPPFDNPELRRAIALSIDRHAFIDILAHGEGEIGGVLQPPPEGLWGLTPEQLQQLPGHGPDVAKNRAEGREIMEKLGYGPDHPLEIKLTSRDWSLYRDPAVLMIDQLKQVYIDGELELVDTAQYFPKLLRKDYTVALNLQTSGPDPDPILQIFYGCGASINGDGYCNPAVDKLIERQSMEGDREKCKPLLWAIEKQLAEDEARPIIFYAKGGTCTEPWVKGLTIMVNSVFNGWRVEDVWLDK
jgi:peptide/nickel transport system substrate-binding protein